MTTYTADLDVRTAVATPTRCPDCGTSALQPFQDGLRLAFRCRDCTKQWRIERGRVLRLDFVVVPDGQK